MGETGLTRWRDRWTSARVPTIPLRPFAKAPVCNTWQQRTPADQWQEVGRDAFRGNIGVITGNGLAVIDADSPETAQRIDNRLEALGLQLPTVKTASETGRHYYVKVKDPPEGNYTHLSPDVGPGELRYGPGAYVVAPCSLVDGNRYAFTQGYPERIPSMQPLQWQDLRWLIAPQTPRVIQELDAPPVRLIKHPVPDRAKELLAKLGQAHGPTRPFEGYISRSEAEAAVVAMMILAGRSFDEILARFTTSKPGHFAEHQKPRRYLQQTYRYCLSALASTPERLQIEQAYYAAQHTPWPGRGGALEQRTYLALLAKAWQFDAWQVRASYRELAEHAAASVMGTHNALDRLQETGLVEQAQSWTLEGKIARATTWMLTRMSNTCTVDTVKTSVGASKVEGLCGDVAAGGDQHRAQGQQEVWAAARLGRSAGMVWRHLGRDPVQQADLARLTGKHRETVARALGILEAHGLAQEAEAGWTRGPDDLATVAKELGADQAANRRRMKHQRQREAWHRQRQEGDDG